MTTSKHKYDTPGSEARVKIEYDVEIDGESRNVQLPFVMGVMADLSGAPAKALLPLAERKFLEINSENFDRLMKSISPRAHFTVSNQLTGAGLIPVDITFDNIDGFSPASVVAKMSSLRQLLAARQQLVKLKSLMDK